jgi:hypothetical protein
MNDAILKLINQKQLASAMNMTKWTELCGSFDRQDETSPNVRYKLLYSEQVFGFSKIWWNQLLHECEAIEWIDFELILREHRGNLLPDRETDISEHIKGVLQAHNIPYSVEGKNFRVWGYISAKNNPVFV